MRQKYVAIIDDDHQTQHHLKRLLEEYNCRVSLYTNGKEFLTSFNDQIYDLIIVEAYLPDGDGISTIQKLREFDSEVSIVMMTGFMNLNIVLRSLRYRIIDFMHKPLEVGYVRREIPIWINEGDGKKVSCENPAGFSEFTRDTLKEVRQIAKSGGDCGMITGEWGTGKNKVAHMLHSYHHAPSAPFVHYNCKSSSDDNTIEKFTGTVGAPGIFERSDGGTLYLCNSEFMSHRLQVLLTEFLETRMIHADEVYRKKIDCLIIVSSEVDLSKCVENKMFDHHLYYKLDNFNIAIPPLRSRKDDLIMLAEYYLSQEKPKKRSLGFTKTAKDKLLSYPFPGNVRELKRIVKKAIVSGEGNTLKGSDIQLTHNSAIRPDSDIGPSLSGHKRKLVERTIDVLVRNNWNRRKSAAELGISYDALRWRIRKYSIGVAD